MTRRPLFGGEEVRNVGATPLIFPHTNHMASRLQSDRQPATLSQVLPSILQIFERLDTDREVDDRLSRQAEKAGRPNVFNLPTTCPAFSELLSRLGEYSRPRRVVINDFDHHRKGYTGSRPTCLQADC